MISLEQPQILHTADGNIRLLGLLADISAVIVNCPYDQFDTAIEESLRRIVETMGLDRGTLWQIADDRRGMLLTHCWQQPDWPLLPRYFDAAVNLPWSYSKVLHGERFHFSNIKELPSAASQDTQNFLIYGPKSNVTIPLFANGEVYGAIAFETLASTRHWTLDELDGLGLIAQILGNVVGRRRAELRAEQLRIELARAFRTSTLSEITAALAHEINQPLTTVLSNAQAARRFISSGAADSGEILAILDDIIRDNKRASAVIDNLKRLLEGAAATREVCCLDQLASEVCDFLDATLAHRNVTLKRVSYPQPLKVRVVRVEIQEVLVNLILNAAQSMVETPLGQRTILIETLTRGEEAIVQVTDRGCGLPAEQVDRLFEPFHSTRPNGLGMGLAICRRVVHAHRGCIQARNHNDGGAVFAFSLPLHTPR